MRKLTTILVCAVLVMLASCGGDNASFDAKKAQALIDKAQSDKPLDQSDYKEMIDLVSNYFSYSEKLIDEAISAAKKGDTEKAGKIINGNRQVQEWSGLCDEMMMVVSTAELDDANKKAYEKLEKQATSMLSKALEAANFAGK